MAAVHAVTVRRAAEFVGGVQVLAAQLDVGEENVKKWIEGQLPVPQEIFLRCVDIVNAHLLEQMSGPNANTSVPKRPG
jgi:hypothetical protein